MSDEYPQIPPVRWWTQLVDPLCPAGSRWSSTILNVQSPDIGDFLVSKLKESAHNVKYDKPIAGWSKKLLGRIGDYENESRLLVKLAGAGRVIQLLEHGIDITLHILHQYNSETRREWMEHLQQEREIRVEKYEDLLSREEDFVKEMGDEEQQVQVLTLMKHDFNRFGPVLTPRELNVIHVSSIFDRLVEQSNTAIGTLPNWFTRGETIYFTRVWST